jgi:hypothetical protein
LLLSAFGCGTSKNPPAHIAKIFKSVILKYAGFFDTIYFAIIDNHYTKNKNNSQGNFHPFERILNGLVVDSPTTLRINAAIGPHRILGKTKDGQLMLSEFCIFDHPPCLYGAQCHELENPQHISTYSHPSICPYQNSTSSCEQTNDEVHMYTFIHITKCNYGGKCYRTEPTPLSKYEHPEFCKHEGRCSNTDEHHLLAYRHVPLCRNGINCTLFLKHTTSHCNVYRHVTI